MKFGDNECIMYRFVLKNILEKKNYIFLVNNKRVIWIWIRVRLEVFFIVFIVIWIISVDISWYCWIYIEIIGIFVNIYVKNEIEYIYIVFDEGI